MYIIRFFRGGKGTTLVHFYNNKNLFVWKNGIFGANFLIIFHWKKKIRLFYIIFFFFFGKQEFLELSSNFRGQLAHTPKLISFFFLIFGWGGARQDTQRGLTIWCGTRTYFFFSFLFRKDIKKKKKTKEEMISHFLLRVLPIFWWQFPIWTILPPPSCCVPFFLLLLLFSFTFS